MDQIKSQVDSLSELSDEQVAELQASIISEFESFESQDPTAESVDAMTSLADMLDSVRGEAQRREAALQELTARASEAAMRVKGEDVTSDSEYAMDNQTDDVTPGDQTDVTDGTQPDATDDGQPTDDTTPAAEVDVVEAQPVVPTDDQTSASDTPMEDMGEAPVETPGQDEGDQTPAEEDQETPEEEKAEPMEEDDQKKAYAVEGAEAATEAVEGSELATNTPESAELSADVAPATEASIESTDAPQEQEGQVPVTAAADESFSAPADRQPLIQVTEAPVAITAGADIPGYTAGSTIDNMQGVAEAMEKRLHSLRRVNGGDGEQHIVASFTTAFPEDRTLGTDAEANWNKVQNVVGPEALTASGGHAAPFQVKYDIYAIGSTTVRPIRDSLPSFQADRGGIRFVTPPRFDQNYYDNAVGIWTAAVDAAPYSNTKTSLTVTAAQEQTVSTDAVTLQLQFGNLMTRAYPELIARHNELALVQHAREAEVNLVSKIGAASTAVTTSSLIGFGRDFLVQVRRAAVGYRSRHRIDVNTQLKAIIPQWVYDAMAADLTLNMPGDNNLGVSKAEIDGYLANSNVTLIPSPDMTVFSAQSAGALLEFPDSFDWFLFAEGTFLFLDGGTLDLGIIRDSTLVGTNDYKMFIETFENAAFVGIESLKITSTINVNGVAAALRDTTGGATAAAIEY